MNTLSDPPELSPLEQEVLEEYELLAENMKKVSPFLLFSPRLLPSHPPIPRTRAPVSLRPMDRDSRSPRRRSRLTLPSSPTSSTP